MKNKKKVFELENQVTVVPIINVSLVVVLTLMMIAPFLSGDEKDIELPTARAAEVDDTDNIEVTYTRDQRIYVGEDEVTMSEVQPYLATLFEGLPHAVAVVKADRSLRYGDVEVLIAEVEASRASRIALATKMPDGEGRP